MRYRFVIRIFKLSPSNIVYQFCDNYNSIDFIDKLFVTCMEYF